MEIVSIEKKTFEMMVASFNALAEKVAALRRRSDGGRMERWLTGEEVCGQLLRRAVRTAAVLACLGAVAGLLLAFYLTFVCSYASLSAANLLVFLLMWLVPTPLIAGMVNKY